MHAKVARDQFDPALPVGRLVGLRGRGAVFLREADGPPGTLPVVLLHGWTWTADLNFADVYAPLAHHHRVIAPDVRGHGRSQRVRGPWSGDDAADDIVALLDVLGIEQALFAGYSMGGVLTTEIARRHPSRVPGVVVQAAAACYTTTPAERTMRALTPAARLGVGPDLAARCLAPAVKGNLEMAMRWDWIHNELRRTSLHDVLKVGAEVARADLRPVLTSPLDCPAEYLLVTGDSLCRPPAQRDLAQRIGARVVEVDTDHQLPVSDPTRYAELTVGAIRRVASATRHQAAS